MPPATQLECSNESGCEFYQESGIGVRRRDFHDIPSINLFVKYQPWMDPARKRLSEERKSGKIKSPFHPHVPAERQIVWDSVRLYHLF